jgi:hypothetical protein
VFRYNLGIAAVFAAFSLYIMASASRLQPGGMAKFGPGYWPYFLGSVLFLLSLALVAETVGRRWLERRRAEAPVPEKPPIEFLSPGLICVYELCFLLLAFVLLLYHINFIVATLIFVPACMWLLGMRKIVTLISVTAGLPLSVYFVFTYLLKIRLP